MTARFKNCLLTFFVLAILITMLITMPSYAHHSRAMFDDSNPLELVGTVEQWQFTNPHVFIILNVTDENGESKIWTLEGLGVNGLVRDGWTPETLLPGDKIMVSVNPLFSGGSGGSYFNLRWEDGSEINPSTGRP